MVFQLVKKFPSSVELERLLSCLQEAAIFPCSEADVFSLVLLVFLLKINFIIIFHCTPRSSKFLQALQPNLHLHLWSLPYLPHAPFFTIIIFGERYKSWISSLFSFLHSSYPSSLLGPIISASTQFSYVINLCSTLSVRDKVSHSHKGTCKIIFMWIQIICFVTPCRLADSYQ